MSSAIVEGDRRAPDWLIRLQVSKCDDPVIAPHGRGNQLGRRAGIESVASMFSDAAQHGSQFGRSPGVCDSAKPTVTKKERGTGRVAGKSVRTFLVIIAECGVDWKSIFREFNGRLHQFRPRQRAVLVVRLVQAGDRSGYACRQRAGERSAGDIVRRVEIHVARRSVWSNLAKVECDVFAVDACDHESAAANVAGCRVRDRECERDRDSCVNGVSTGPEYRQSGPCCVRRRRHNHGRVAARDGGRSRPGCRRRDRDRHLAERGNLGEHSLHLRRHQNSALLARRKRRVPEGARARPRFAIARRSGRIARESAGARVIIVRSEPHLHDIGMHVEHHGCLDFVGMRAAGLLANAVLSFLADFQYVRVHHHDSTRGERIARGCEGAQCRHAGVQHVEAARAVTCDRSHDVDDHVTRRLEPQRRRAGILGKRRVEAVVDSRIDDNGGGGSDRRAEILGEQPIVVQRQMRAVLLGLSAKRNHHNRRRVKQLRGIRPG